MLKPCPFCGGSGLEMQDPMLPPMWVVCSDCEAEGPLASSVQDAEDAWNRRAPLEEKDG